MYHRLATLALACLVGSSSHAGEPSSGQESIGRAPSAAEWKGAPSVTAERSIGALSQRCVAHTLRGWLSVRCDFPVSAMTQLGGSRNGVTFVGASPDARQLPQSGTVRFPASGAPRVFLFWTLGEGYDGPLTVIPAVVLSSEGGPDGQPHFRLHEALHEPVATARSVERRLARGTATSTSSSAVPNTTSPHTAPAPSR